MSKCKNVWARWWAVFVSLLLAPAICTTMAWGVEPFSAEPADLREADLPQSVVSSVEGQGTRLFTYVNGLRTSICEIFWAKTVVTQSGKYVLGRATYSNLEPGSFLGVIRFLADASDEYREDFHDQKLKAGYYTMRYAVMAEEDARDFLVLSPVSADSEPSLILASDQVIRQGKLASRTDRPAVLSLVTTELGSKNLPSVRMDENGTCILQDKLHTKSNASAGDVTLAVILVNPISEEDGS